jgi:ribosome-associated protein
MMLRINPKLSLNNDELSYEFIHASGPGGQNVNKVATAVQLRFDVAHSTSLPLDVKERLSKLAGFRMTRLGVLVIEAKRYRTREQNRLDAEQRLANLIRKAMSRPRKRYLTRPGAAAVAKRLEAKKRNAAIKRLRRSLPEKD